MQKLIRSALVILPLIAIFFFWKRGTPYQESFRSPNGQYRVQKFANFVPSMAMPGQGSDAVSGYVRLFDARGRLLHERFVPFLRDVAPMWSGDRVYLMGVADMDDHPWTLPATSE